MYKLIYIHIIKIDHVYKITLNNINYCISTLIILFYYYFYSKVFCSDYLALVNN